MKIEINNTISNVVVVFAQVSLYQRYVASF